MSDPMIRLLAKLPSVELDRARAERIRMRCRAQLARQARRPPADPASVWRRRTAQVWQPLIAFLGVAYLTEVVFQALRVYGLL